MSSTLIAARGRSLGALIAAALVVGMISLGRLPAFGLDPDVEDVALFGASAALAGWLLAPRARRNDGSGSLAGTAGRFGCLAGGVGPLFVLVFWTAIALLPGGNEIAERNQILATFVYAGPIVGILMLMTIAGSVVGLAWAIAIRLLNPAHQEVGPATDDRSS